jgi:hypothetical protein
MPRRVERRGAEIPVEGKLLMCNSILGGDGRGAQMLVAHMLPVEFHFQDADAILTFHAAEAHR